MKWQTDFFQVQPYFLQCKDKFWIEPVKGKMNSPPAQAIPSLPLTEPIQNLNPHLRSLRIVMYTCIGFLPIRNSDV